MTSQPTLVLLHAFPLSPVMWRELVPYLGGEVITPSLPGFGDAPALADAPNVDAFADAILNEVSGPLVVGGCSMGGYVAMAMMRLAPERIAGVILMDTKPEADGEAARARREEVATGVERDGMTAWIDPLFEPLLGTTSRASNPELVEQVRDVIASAQPQGVAWAQRAMAARPDSRGILSNWKKPALVIVGSEDQLAPVETARGMAELIPQGELAVIQGAGHLAPWEAPDRVAEVIAGWWATSFPLAE